MGYNGRLFGSYAVDSSLPNLTRIHARILTHLFIAFGVLREGRVTVEKLGNLQMLRVIKEYNPEEIRILLSIGGWGEGGYSEAVGTSEGRALFARTALDILREHDLDGLDIDWEYPCDSEADIGSSPEDRRTVTAGYTSFPLP